MTKEKAKGTAAETAVCLHLNNNTEWKWFRTAPAGSKDVGDIQTPSVPVVIEVKNCQRQELAKWVDEAEQEAINTGDATMYAVWHKRRGKGRPADWYVTMSGSEFTFLLNRAFG